ncbi:MAG: Gfo/Idh/MocA family oxidoreductase [Lentisphaerae bacterium]|nr:Gfo/Idh/MocA family oxidoreductase [Lentisphaerota bacterium]
MMSREFISTRRGFMFGCGAFSLSVGAAGVDLAPKDSYKGKIEGRRLRIASIGCGGMGRSATESLISAGCDLVAVCDIDPAAFDHWEKKMPGIPKFTDYREMLRTLGDRFEAVQVGTPDHTHAYISIDCMNAGKHVYVQKPLARTVEECELMLKTSLRTGCVVQMGNQGHPGVWRYKALRDADAWGEIKEIYSWSDRPIWPQGMEKYAKSQPLPANFSENAWDCWCGPSADHGYSPAYHRFKWRGWWDYGCGAIGDMAVHNADPAFWTFELGLPVKVKADTFGGDPVSIAYPKKSRIEMDFASNRWIPHGVKVVWTDGGVKPDMKSIVGLEAYAAKCAVWEENKKASKAKKEGKPYTPPAELPPFVPTNGLIIVGSRATSISGSHAHRPVCIAGDKATFDTALAKGDSAAKYSHYREFVEACLCKAPEKCGSKLSYAAPLTEALLIGCIALRYPGEELVFDAYRMCFTNKQEANEFLKAPKRKEWDFAKLCAQKQI